MDDRESLFESRTIIDKSEMELVYKVFFLRKNRIMVWSCIILGVVVMIGSIVYLFYRQMQEGLSLGAAAGAYIGHTIIFFILGAAVVAYPFIRVRRSGSQAWQLHQKKNLPTNIMRRFYADGVEAVTDTGSNYVGWAEVKDAWCYENHVVLFAGDTIFPVDLDGLYKGDKEEFLAFLKEKIKKFHP